LPRAGSHLEDYVFFGDVMCGWIYSTDTYYAPTPYGQAILSGVTLGLLEDLGYYTANWERQGMLTWASGAGCGFVNSTCEAFAAAEPAQPFFLGAAGAACLSDRCGSAMKCSQIAAARRCKHDVLVALVPGVCCRVVQ
jgi:Leishmanolysin